MPWVYLDDHIDEHDKTIAAGDAAFGFWVRLVAFCRRKQNGGRVPKSLDQLHGQRAKIAKLLDVQYLDDGGDVWLIHDYEEMYGDEEVARQKRKAKAKAAADARWGVQKHAHGDARSMPASNDQASPEQCSNDASHARPRAGSPSPSLSSKSSSSYLGVGDQAEDDEDEDRGRLLRATWRLLAERRLETRERELGPVGNRDAWLAATIAGLAPLHGEAYRLLDAEPNSWTPELLADAVEPQAAPAANGRSPDPTEQSAAAAAERRRRQALPPCETCDSTGWVEGDDGLVPCSACERVAVA